jgi:hypothetical protein
MTPCPTPYAVERRIAGFAHIPHEVDVCVVGGGMAGLIAAIAAARHGAQVALIHDRSVLGGNASSEVRMHICGAHGPDCKETGLLEEIQLDNCRRNPRGNYPVWDGVLYEKAAFCPGLTLLLNATVNAATMDGPRLASVTAWQLTTQTWHTVRARQFIDCSGDSVLAPLTGALVRAGRESRDEFGEDIEPREADDRTMGSSILLQLRETAEPQPFTPPRWAYKFLSPADLPKRHISLRTDNFWWIEVGGLQDTIADAEAIRDELLKVAYGLWDYIKNYHPARAEHENWALEWIGSLPGKRENRRYVGGHILTQNDVRAGGPFPDVVAHGGWSMDDHHPAGIYYPGWPTIFHPAPSPFGIPWRCLYSRSVPNLLCAGRNISVTHAALSSVRVMGTTSVMGQAAGTGAALCVRHGCDPSEIYPARIAELQALLQDDDQWLPGRPRAVSAPTLSARISCDRGAVANEALATGTAAGGALASGPLPGAALASAVVPAAVPPGAALAGGALPAAVPPGVAFAGGDAGLEALRDGHDRPAGENPHAWTGALGDAIVFAWPEPISVAGLRIVFDSDLSQPKRMPNSYPLTANHDAVPASMVRRFRVDAQTTDGDWATVHREEDNHQRLVRLPLSVCTAAIRVVPEATWGAAATSPNTPAPTPGAAATSPNTPAPTPSAAAATSGAPAAVSGASAVRIFSIDVLDRPPLCPAPAPEGEHWPLVVARIPSEDLAEPDSGLETA